MENRRKITPLKKKKTNKHTHTLQIELLYDAAIPILGGGGLVAKLCQTLAASWAIACQDPLPMRFSR